MVRWQQQKQLKNKEVTQNQNRTNMSTTFTAVEAYPQNKRSTIAIRPFFDAQIDNMGLQQYGISLFDNTFHEEQLACLEINGVKRYVTGLNEFAPEVYNLPPEEREAKIKQIRITVSYLEQVLASNVVDPTDKDFWSKIKLLKPDNDTMWEKIRIRCSNDPRFLEPDKDPYDLIILTAIEAGGFSMVSPSLEHCKDLPTPTRFYLDKLETTASSNTEVKKQRNKALAELEKMFNKQQNKLFYVAKILDPSSAQYKKTTPVDIFYDNMDKYINGELLEKDKRKTAERFLETVNQDMATLTLRSLIKDASFYKFISTKSDGMIYNMSDGAMMGRTPTEVLEYLKNPLNEKTLDDMTKRVEKYWNQ